MSLRSSHIAKVNTFPPSIIIIGFPLLLKTVLMHTYSLVVEGGEPRQNSNTIFLGVIRLLNSPRITY